MPPDACELAWFWKILWPFLLLCLKSVLRSRKVHLTLLLPMKFSNKRRYIYIYLYIYIYIYILLYLLFLVVFGFKQHLGRNSFLVSGFHSFSSVMGFVECCLKLVTFRFWFISVILHLPLLRQASVKIEFLFLEILSLWTFFPQKTCIGFKKQIPNLHSNFCIFKL